MSAHLHRVQYPFQQKTLQKLLRTVSELHENLDLATSTLQLDVSIRSLDRWDQVNTDLKKVIEGQEQEKSRALSVEDRAMINWLSPLEFFSKQNDAQSRCQKGTGQWLLKSVEFRAWLDTAAKVLWCPGMR